VDLVELARSLSVLEQVDVSDFQRRARILQAIWREEQGFPCGEQRSKAESRPLGSRLPMPWAQESLANFSPQAREVVRSEVCDWTLEDVCDRLRQRSQVEWIAVFTDRYLAFSKVTQRLERGKGDR